ncbi:MAG TPA: type II secretion system protein [Candidatus Pacearchaeota archaeon]|nr:type II secretion system protein [Candidatus Pacearchaeota archaeon]
MEKFNQLRKPIAEHLESKRKLGLMKDKRGMTIGDIYPTMLVIALVAILIAVVLLVLDKFGDQMDNDSLAQNATENIAQQISDFVPWIGIILLIIAAAIVIGILVNNLGGGKRV